MNILRHLTYSNVVATLALFIALGGGAYALNKGSVNSREIATGAVRSKEIKNRTIRKRDVGRNELTGKQIIEARLDASQFTATKSSTGLCNPNSAEPAENCGNVRMTLPVRGRVFVVAAAVQKSGGVGNLAVSECRLQVDGNPMGEFVRVRPGESSDGTVFDEANGFAITAVTPSPLRPGPHDFTLACEETDADAVIQDVTISALAIGARR